MTHKKADKLLNRVKNGFRIPESTVNRGRTTKRKWVSTEEVDALVKRQRTALGRCEFLGIGVSVLSHPPVAKQMNDPDPNPNGNPAFGTFGVFV